MPRIGVLALQGDFKEHMIALEVVGAQSFEVRLPKHLDMLDGLIIPGGESTTLRRLSDAYGLIDPLRKFGVERPIWGTCAGAIFLAKHVEGQESHLNLMNITIQRNAFGRQIDSFIATVDIEGVRYPAVFIRAPIIVKVDPTVKILARLPDGRIIAAQEGRLLATSFHPELTRDVRFHERFLQLVEGSLG